MKYEPQSTDERFNEWYREFHLLFEDSYAEEEECMEIAKACYDRAQEAAVNKIWEETRKAYT